MTTPVDDELNDLAAELDLLGDWEERYRHLIDLGRALEPLSEAEHGEANKVKGCASQVWLVTRALPGGGLELRGDSDSSLVRGLIAILVRLYGGRDPRDILAFDVKAGFRRLGFEGAISSQRSNGFFSMVERIRRDARALAPA